MESAISICIKRHNLLRFITTPDLEWITKTKYDNIRTLHILKRKSNEEFVSWRMRVSQSRETIGTIRLMCILIFAPWYILEYNRTDILNILYANTQNFCVTSQSNFSRIILLLTSPHLTSHRITSFPLVFSPHLPWHHPTASYLVWSCRANKRPRPLGRRDEENHLLVHIRGTIDKLLSYNPNPAQPQTR